MPELLWASKMLVKRPEDCKEIVAGDESILYELLSPIHDAGVKSRYSLAHARVLPGKTTRWHTMRTAEVYYILRGVGEMQVDDETAPVEKGSAVYIPPNARQRIRNTGDADLEFLCLVDPAWRPEDETV